MGSILVGDAFREIKGDVLDGASLFSKTYEQEFPKYLFYGMTEEQYWDGENYLPSAYREAYDMKLKHDNMIAWYQGRYVYDAIISLIPALNSFGNGKIEPYVEKMYPITMSEFAEIEAKHNKQKSIDNAVGFLQGWAAKVNAERNK